MLVSSNVQSAKKSKSGIVFGNSVSYNEGKREFYFLYSSIKVVSINSIINNQIYLNVGKDESGNFWLNGWENFPYISQLTDQPTVRILPIFKYSLYSVHIPTR